MGPGPEAHTERIARAHVRGRRGGTEQGHDGDAVAWGIPIGHIVVPTAPAG